MWNTDKGQSQAQWSLSRESEAAVSTERRWQSSLCRRGTSGSRKLGWSSLCRASSSTLSPGRIFRAWRTSKSLLCHKQPEWDRRIRNINERNTFLKTELMQTYRWESAAWQLVTSVWTHMSIGDVEQVFDPTAFIKTQLVTNGLLDDHVVCLLRSENLIDVLCRSHCIHLVSLQREKKGCLVQFASSTYVR